MINILYRIKGMSTGHYIGNWLGSWVSLIDSVVGILTFGLYGTNFLWLWLQFRWKIDWLNDSVKDEL
jgi:hypothetical protein